MEKEINSKIEDNVCEILKGVHRSINISNSIKEIDGDFFNHHFFFGYPRNVKFNFNILLDNSTQDEVKIEFEVPLILKKKFSNE